MRLARLATPIALLTLFVAGCGGGSKVVVKEVPGGSANLTVKGGDALAPKATATATAEASATATPDGSTSTDAAPAQQQQPSQQQSTTQPQSTATAQATPQGTTGGGGAAAPDATPVPGSDAQQFETFCQQNPGAC